MSKTYYDIVFTHEKQLFLGVLNDSQDTVIDFELIKYSENYDQLTPDECCIVVVEEENNKRKLIPLQSIKLQDDEGNTVIIGKLDIEDVLESANNVYKNIKNIIKYH